MDKKNTVVNIRYSLLVPCYNAAKYVDKFITHLSTLSKSFDETIFYDDASDDDTAQLLSSKGVKVIKGEVNKGPGFARNRLAEAAKGGYIHFHDIDDEFNPLFLPLINEQLKTNSTDVILGYADWIDEATRKTIIEWRYNKDEINKDPLSYFIANPLGIINTIYKKEAFLKVKGFNENIKCWEDADLHVRLAASGATFSVIDQVMAFSLRHSNGLSKNQKWCWNCRVKFLNEYVTSISKKYQPIIGGEFEKAAYSLFHFNQFSKAVQAFHSSRDCSYDAPATNNRSLKLLKKISPLMAFITRGMVIKLKKR